MSAHFFAADIPVLAIVLCVIGFAGACLASCIGESADHSDGDDHGH